MSVVLSISQNNVFNALRAFLLNILPSGIEVFQAQTNRVAEPLMTDFVSMTPIMQEKIETNTTTYIDNFPSAPQVRIDLAPTKVTIQLDVHGPNSADNAQIISNLFRTSYAVDFFGTSGFDVVPLYSEDPHQSPFSNGEQQIEQRWTIDVVMQSNPLTTVAQQFADQLKVGIINVDATYPA